MKKKRVISDAQVRKMCKCVEKMLKSKIPLSNACIKQLTPHKTALRKLASKKTSLKTKRQLLQKGGLLWGLKEWLRKKRAEVPDKYRW